jgi:hypothetical protein
MEERSMSVNLRTYEWLMRGFIETEAWASIQENCEGAITYGTWNLPKKEQNTLEGKWLIAWNTDWIICRNYDYGTISTTMWANGHRGGEKHTVENRPKVRFQNGNTNVAYAGDTHYFRIYDPITDKDYSRHWLVIKR